jgi:GNAT superfamily N-acetyltransferase
MYSEQQVGFNRCSFSSEHISLEKHGTVVGAAYSSLVCGRGIEVGVFVLEDCRRQGIATILASRLLKWCIENSAEANWGAANPELCRLAEKLGYIQTGEYQAYYLKAEQTAICRSVRCSRDCEPDAAGDLNLN